MAPFGRRWTYGHSHVDSLEDYFPTLKHNPDILPVYPFAYYIHSYITMFFGHPYYLKHYNINQQQTTSSVYISRSYNNIFRRFTFPHVELFAILYTIQNCVLCSLEKRVDSLKKNWCQTTLWLWL